MRVGPVRCASCHRDSIVYDEDEWVVTGALPSPTAVSEPPPPCAKTKTAKPEWDYAILLQYSSFHSGSAVTSDAAVEMIGLCVGPSEQGTGLKFLVQNKRHIVERRLDRWIGPRTSVLDWTKKWTKECRLLDWTGFFLAYLGREGERQPLIRKTCTTQTTGLVLVLPCFWGQGGDLMRHSNFTADYIYYYLDSAWKLPNQWWPFTFLAYQLLRPAYWEVRQSQKSMWTNGMYTEPSPIHRPNPPVQAMFYNMPGEAGEELRRPRVSV